MQRRIEPELENKLDDFLREYLFLRGMAREWNHELENKLDDFLESVHNTLLDVPAKAPPKSTQCAICNSCYPEIITFLTKGRCLECALEIEFGVVPPLAPTSVGGGTPFYYISEDDDPMLHNCMRILEGD